MEEFVPVKYGIERKGDQWEAAGDSEVLHEHAKSEIRGTTRLFCGSCGSDWLTRNQDGEGLPMVYRATAHHFLGASVAHPCKPGQYDDPTDSFSELIEATSYAQAKEKAWKKLREDVEGWERCACSRERNPGTRAWWDSVIVTVWL